MPSIRITLDGASSTEPHEILATVEFDHAVNLEYGLKVAVTDALRYLRPYTGRRRGIPRTRIEGDGEPEAIGGTTFVAAGPASALLDLLDTWKPRRRRRKEKP